MAALKLNNLDFDKMDNWIKKADSEKNINHVNSFISAWIGFNYYYSTFANAHYSDFISWTKKNDFKRGERTQWLYLIRHKDFIEFFDNYKKLRPEIFEVKIVLPIISMLYNTKVPADISGEFKFSDMNVEQLFSVIYQIRNNLFHGNKDPEKDKRDMQLSMAAGNFMVSFLLELSKKTYGRAGVKI